MERSFIGWAALQSAKLPKVELGIGDDAAILSGSDQSVVITCDSLCEGTHFISSACGWHAVGRKAAAVNLSDIAAMGATAESLFLSFCLPREKATSIAQELYLGALEVAKQFDVAIAGGDTNTWDGPLVVHATATGRVASGMAWRRDGAKTGDAIVVSGELGGSILGKHLSFEPRLALVTELRRVVQVTSACDISDGLGNDLLNICSASRCGAELILDKVPIAKAAFDLAVTSNKTPIQHAMGDGEDFELLFTVPAAEVAKLPAEICNVPLTVIGKVVSRTGLWSKASNGKIQQLPATGYQH